MNQNITPQLLPKLTSLGELSPAQLKDLIELLKEQESSPGGPYLLSSSTKKNVSLNLKIYLLFLAEGKLLNGCFSYLQSTRQLLTNSEQALLETSLRSSINSSPLSKNSSISSQKGAPTPFQQLLHVKLAKELSPELYEHIKPLVTKLSLLDKDGEISKLSPIFIDSLDPSAALYPNPFTIDLLSEANFYTWLAYSLYDNVIDNEGSALDIPAANILQRMALQTYINTGIKPTTVQKAFTKVDTANSEEIAHCRYKLTGDTIHVSYIPSRPLLRKLLAERSAIHCLGPYELAVEILKIPYSRLPFRQIFANYCAVRQMNDDIHDWEEDLANGHITYVVAHLLNATGTKSGSYKLSYLTAILKKALWETELEKLLNECLEIALHTRNEYVTALHLVENSQFDAITVGRIITSLEKALKQLAYDKEFIQLSRNTSET